jgi:hypothetical protein
MRIIPDNARKQSEIFELSAGEIDSIYLSYVLLPDEVQKLKYDCKFSNYFILMVTLRQLGIITG